MEVARRPYPDLRFEVGPTAALDPADGELGGIVAWWSIIHTNGGARQARRPVGA
ncbi:hypothetical protein ACFC1R_33435 [Kitasatospora sp. NPDC056138]|uniref:hypothetical protein n=1 Tax=Kitasatospora sp. NPDC056138 TaxID=3345724 RepID=UPI0035E29CBA